MQNLNATLCERRQQKFSFLMVKLDAIQLQCKDLFGPEVYSQKHTYRHPSIQRNLKINALCATTVYRNVHKKLIVCKQKIQSRQFTHNDVPAFSINAKRLLLQ